MSESLLEQLPKIVARGKQVAERILEQSEGSRRITLQTRELVIPSRATDRPDLFRPTTGVDSTTGLNRLIYGDNLLAMAALLAGDETNPSMRGKIDLIYIDPPFDSKADYRTKVTLPGTTIDKRPTALEQFAYSDTWADGTASYLAMLVPRLVLMRELLSETGAFFVHTDWRVNSFVRLVSNDIFGSRSFRNEIVWRRAPNLGRQAASSQLGRVIDTIHVYSKVPGSEFRGVPPFRSKPVGLNSSGKPENAKWDEAAGSYFTTAPRGDYTDESIEQLERENRIYRSATGTIYIKYFLRPSDNGQWLKDQRIDCLWDDFDVRPLRHRPKGEDVGYSTQKPEGLLERIISWASAPGDLVADFFVGSGTTAAVAERLGRRWIASDFGKPAVMISRKRLIDQDAKPFLYDAIGEYHVEQARSTLGRDYRVRDLAQVVLQLYGAVPLPSAENPSGNLGRIPNTKTLVLADSPSKLVTSGTLKSAVNQRDSRMGGFNKVVVLGWNFSADIGGVIDALNDPGLEVLTIPPDLLDRLKKKGMSIDQLAGDITFSSLQYLTAHVVSRKRSGDSENIKVQLDNYVLLSPEALNLDAENKVKLLRVMNAEPLALIEYWAVDPTYDGKVFRSVWQDYRDNTEVDDDPLRVITTGIVEAEPVDGPRTICIRAVDVFGLESEVIVSGVELER